MARLIPASPPLTQRPFGRLPDGREVRVWTLRNRSGMEVEAMEYGATVTKILTPDRDQEIRDVVLGFDSLAGYLGDHPYFGATVGRIAGRVTQGRITIDGSDLSLPINDPPNHLHGGPSGFDEQLWTSQAVQRADGCPSVCFSLQSPDGDQGYPGKVTCSVTYSLTEENALVVETEAVTDRLTPVSLTHHSYFHLGRDHQQNVLDHLLQVRAGHTFACDEKMTVLDRLIPMEGHPSDLRAPTRLGEVVPKLWQQHGDLYWLGGEQPLRCVAFVHEPNSGRSLAVATTQSCLQLYTSAALDGSLRGKGGIAYPKHGAFCLECQGYPNATTTSDFGDILVQPDKPQRHLTVYTFGATDPFPVSA